MKQILLIISLNLSLILTLTNSLLGQNISQSGYCKSIVNESAMKNYVPSKTSSHNKSCTSYYVNVYFHFIRDNSGNTGEPVTNVPLYMGILNNAFNAHNIYFVLKGHDEINNSTFANVNYDFAANFSSVTTNYQSDAINMGALHFVG